MPVGFRAGGLLRWAAAIMAALWAIAGLADDTVELTAVGPSVRPIVDALANASLVFAAVLAFIAAGGWRRFFVAALIAASLSRIALAIGSGAAFAQIAGAVVAFAVIAALAFAGITRRGG